MLPAVSARDAPRVWPEGWSWNPLRFVASRANGKSVAHALVLVVLWAPLSLLCLTGLVLVPAVGRVSDDLWRGLAAWRGRQMPHPREDAVDWRHWVCAAGQTVLGALVTAGLLVIMSLMVAFAAVALLGGQWDVWGWRPSGGADRAIAATVAVGMLLAGLALCWITSGLSVALWALLTLSRTTVDDLELSRRVLTDAFTGERRRIERELHDGVQQYLTATQLALATARIRVQDNTDALAALEMAQASTRRATTALRHTIRGIHPQVLDEEGLTEAVRELAGLSGLRATVHVEGQVANQHLDSAVALFLYHAVAEALTNAVRHGQARGVTITLDWQARSVEVTVVDDGTGPHGDNTAASGTGLAAMAEQAGMLGGGMEFGWDPSTRGGRVRVWAAREPHARGRVR